MADESPCICVGDVLIREATLYPKDRPTHVLIHGRLKPFLLIFPRRIFLYRPADEAPRFEPRAIIKDAKRRLVPILSKYHELCKPYKIIFPS